MTCCTVNKFVSVRLFFALYVVDAHQDFYMRIAMRISAYADHPHEPHGSATAWPTLICAQIVWLIGSGMLHFVFGASPQRFLCHFPNKIASFPQQFASFPQQNCFISPTTWVTSPTTCVTSPTHFLISPTTLCHFAPHQKIMIFKKKFLGFIS